MLCFHYINYLEWLSDINFSMLHSLVLQKYCFILGGWNNFSLYEHVWAKNSPTKNTLHSMRNEQLKNLYYITGSNLILIIFVQ